MPRMASMNLVQLEARNNTGAILLALIFILPLNELAEPLKMNWGLWLKYLADSYNLGNFLCFDHFGIEYPDHASYHTLEVDRELFDINILQLTDTKDHESDSFVLFKVVVP